MTYVPSGHYSVGVCDLEYSGGETKDVVCAEKVHNSVLGDLASGLANLRKIQAHAGNHDMHIFVDRTAPL